VTFPVSGGIFGVDRLAQRLNVLTQSHRINGWHPGPWIDWRHAAIRIDFDTAADAALAELACRDVTD
jgi:hypothetical protein